MKKYLLVTIAAVAAGAAILLAFLMTGREPECPVLVLTGADPFRGEVLTALKRTLADRCDLRPSDVREVEFGGAGADTDGVDWDSLPLARVLVCLLPPGKRPIRCPSPVVMGPLRGPQRGFIAANPGVSFLVSDLFDLPLAESLAGLGVPPRPLVLAAMDCAGGRAAFSAARGIPPDAPFAGDLLRSGAERAVPEGSLVLFASDGVPFPMMRDLARRLAARRSALVLDRTGYLGCGVLAELSVDPEAAGEALGRLAARALTSERSPDVREVVVLRRRYDPAVAKDLGVPVDPRLFTPLP